MSQEKIYRPCGICVAACGLEITVDDGKITRIAPDKMNPYTWRDFCPKGRTANQLVEHPRRLLHPMRRVGDQYVEASWDEAISDITSRLRVIIDRDGPDAVALYWGNPAGQSGSTPMFAAGFMDAIGTSSRYFVGSIDQNALHVVAEQMFGSIFLTLVPDVDECDCFLLVGMNPAVSAFNWVDNVPDGWRRALAAQAEGADLIVVDPVLTATAEAARTHIAIRPGEDWAFLLGLVKVILENRWENRADQVHFAEFDALESLAGRADLDDLALRCDVAVNVIIDVAHRFAKARSAMVLTHTGVSMGTNGTLGEWLGQVLNLITGRIDRPGGRRYERGYIDAVALFDQLAKPQDGVTRVRGLPAIAGYHALAELPDEILTPGEGRVRALIIDGGNPVVSGPDGAALDEGLADLELLVAIDLVQRESHRHAHWLLPAAHWLERDELHGFVCQLQDQPYVQFGRRAVPAPPDVREEWQIFTDLCLALKAPLFGRRGLNTLVKSTRWLSTRLSRPGIAFSPRWIDRLLVRLGRRITWKQILAHPHGWLYAKKEYGNFWDAVRTDDGLVHLAPASFVTAADKILSGSKPVVEEFPLILTGRRHKESMNSFVNELPGLHRGMRSNDLDIHPDTAKKLGIVTGDLVKVDSVVSSIEVKAFLTDRTRPDVVVCAHGWGSRIYDPINGNEPVSYGVNRNLLVDGYQIDPLSQTPALGSTSVRVRLVGRSIEHSKTD